MRYGVGKVVDDGLPLVQVAVERVVMGQKYNVVKATLTEVFFRTHDIARHQIAVVMGGRFVC